MRSTRSWQLGAWVLVCGVAHAAGANGPGSAIRASHPVSARSSIGRIAVAPDTVNVVAARISFPAEVPDNSFTTGTGLFDTSHTIGVDAAPHDLAYFQAHLEFLRDYVAAASAGRTVVRILLLPNAAIAPRTMGAYAPPSDSPTNLELARFVDEAWRAADSANAQFDFASLDPARTLYVVFHAGVGRDVDVSSQLGYNPQPQDLPSLYFNPAALRAALGAGYAGIQTHDGAHILNTAVIPETETREINGAHTVLGVNGVLAASFGSYLGLPDLFNTANGYTAIGRFGLEDVASIFAFGGFFPPLPNAWERTALGWATSVDAHADTARMLAVTAQQLANAADTTVVRVDINVNEYFLCENRQRDPGAHGIDVSVRKNDSTVKYHFSGDVYGFRDGDLSGLPGVIVGCSNHDWAVAGSGICIWHIDENIIASHRDDNSVNASGHTRGVRLMEADGAQQIGVPVNTPFGVYISQGYDGDAWQRGNEANFPRYSNVFSDTTQPDTRSNSGERTGLQFSAFDTTQARMRFTLQNVAAVHAVAGFPQSVGAAAGSNPVVTADIDGDDVDEIFYATATNLLAWRADGSKVIPNGDQRAVFADEPGIVVGPSVDATTNRVFAVSAHNGEVALQCWVAKDSNGDGRADLVFRSAVPITSPRTILPPMIVQHEVYVAADTMLFTFAENGTLQSGVSIRDRRAGPIAPVTAWASTVSPTGIIPDSIAPRIVLNESGARITMVFAGTGAVQWSRDVSLAAQSSVTVGDVTGDAKSLEVFALGRDGRSVILDLSGNVLDQRSAKSPTTGAAESTPALCPAIVSGQTTVTGGVTHLFANNSQGMTSANFPVSLAAGITQVPVITGSVRIERSGTETNGPAIVAGTEDGLLHAIGIADGREADGFPLSIGSTLAGCPALGRAGVAGAEARLYAVTTSGHLVAYANGPALSPGMASQMFVDAAHANYIPASPASPSSSDFFPKDRVFNWPNPVREKFTHIRFYVATNATVHIAITNLANELVMELPVVQATGGIDNDVELRTTGIQSGVYIVRVEAEGSGNTGVAFIKMAIVN